MVYPTTESSDLSPEQRRLLDDAFFESNAASYWRSRIDALLRAAETIDYTSALAADVTGHGIDPQMLSMTEPTDSEREAQRALDAFALRHHVAESLVRLVRAVLRRWQTPNSSIWAMLAGDRDDGYKVVKSLRAFEARGELPAHLFVPASELRALPAEPPKEVARAVRMHWRWVQRAMELLVSDGLDTNAGNNKLKHGLAVRARDDLRVRFMTQSPRPDGTIPMTNVEGSSPIIDAHALEFLERLPSRHEHAGSWEVTVLNLRPATLLAETLVLTTVWASVFASAASDHFEGRDERGPTHPGLVLGPSPEAINRRATGYRQALTTSTKSSTSRGLTVETPGGVVGLVQTGPWTHGTVVDQ